MGAGLVLMSGITGLGGNGPGWLLVVGAVGAVLAGCRGDGIMAEGMMDGLWFMYGLMCPRFLRMIQRIHGGRFCAV